MSLHHVLATMYIGACFLLLTQIFSLFQAHDKDHSFILLCTVL